MPVKEIVLPIENKPGELSRIIAHLYENDVEVFAFWVGEDNGSPVLRFISNDPESAISLLTGLSLEAETAEVIVAHIPTHPGGLNALFKVLAAAKIDISHVYPGLGPENTILVLHVNDQKKAVEALKEGWIHMQ